MMSNPAPGWYPAPHADGELRYWDGTAWLADPPVDASAGTVSAAKPGFFRRTTTRRTATWVAGGAFVLGAFIGVGAGGSGSASTIEELESEVSILQESIDSTEASAQEDAEQADALEQEAESLQGEVDDLQTQLTAAKKALSTAEADLSTATARVAELEAAAAAPAPAPAPADPPPTVDVYYENCTAVRAAGAAPIRAGDPGYGSHLDRDGDGIACE